MENTIKIIKKKIVLNRIYYDLILNNEVVGMAWITKKYRYLFNGLYIKLTPRVRHKGYGIKYYELLLIELSNNNVESIIIWVKNNNKYISFFDKAVNRYSDRLKFFNYTGFVEDLIIE